MLQIAVATEVGGREGTSACTTRGNMTHPARKSARPRVLGALLQVCCGMVQRQHGTGGGEGSVMGLRRGKNT